MARPKLNPDSPTVRLDMVIPADELAVIDAWASDNGFTSRAAAIRWLCQKGVEGGLRVPTLGEVMLMRTLETVRASQ